MCGVLGEKRYNGSGDDDGKDWCVKIWSQSRLSTSEEAPDGDKRQEKILPYVFHRDQTTQPLELLGNKLSQCLGI